MPKKIVNVEKGKKGFQRNQSRVSKPPTASSRSLLHPDLKPSPPPRKHTKDLHQMHKEYSTTPLPIPEDPRLAQLQEDYAFTLYDAKWDQNPALLKEVENLATEFAETQWGRQLIARDISYMIATPFAGIRQMLREVLVKQEWRDSPLWRQSFGEHNLIFKYHYGEFGHKRTEYGTNLVLIEDPNPELMTYWVVAYDEDLPSEAENNIPVGWFSWSRHNGVIYFINVRKEFQHQGIATHMFNLALMLAENNVALKPKHSDNRTPSGDAFAHRVGGELPVNLGEGLHEGF